MMLRNEEINRDWRREYIVAAVHVKGFTLRQLSLKAGLKADSLRNVLDRPCKKYERIVAEAIGVTPEETWPSRYPRSCEVA
ncbi:helix-turn-helix domain-containing protein [Candidatus Sodalis sp. SoCistrobi]|uniref:helix-turn-helix domain-containing protein n=1 Tax=Candidatus Sodalis sp. SoCistrobi TaxID=1922216 RepID=UPI00093888F5|nr:helix-turn-helix domain-containing protein [Candidatus Sodalis sp. SoCistrobi]